MSNLTFSTFRDKCSGPLLFGTSSCGRTCIRPIRVWSKATLTKRQSTKSLLTRYVRFGIAGFFGDAASVVSMDSFHSSARTFPFFDRCVPVQDRSFGPLPQNSPYISNGLSKCGKSSWGRTSKRVRVCLSWSHIWSKVTLTYWQSIKSPLTCWRSPYFHIYILMEKK